MELMFTVAKYVFLLVAALFIGRWGQQVLVILTQIRDRLPEKSDR